MADDASLGIVYTTLFAIGVIMFTQFAAKTQLDPGCFLYGLLEFAPGKTIDIAGFTAPQMLPSLLINGVYTLLFVLAAWKVLPTTSIDAGFAATIGIRTNFVNLLLMAFVAASAVTAFESLGSIVVVAMLIVPAATARLLTNRLGTMIAWAIAVAAASAVVGNIAALEWNTNTAGMIAVAAGFQFALAVALAPQQGLVSAWLRRFSLNVRIAAEDIIGMLYRAEESAGRHESRRPRLLHEPAEALARHRGLVGDSSPRWSITKFMPRPAERWSLRTPVAKWPAPSFVRTVCGKRTWANKPNCRWITCTLPRSGWSTSSVRNCRSKLPRNWQSLISIRTAVKFRRVRLAPFGIDSFAAGSAPHSAGAAPVDDDGPPLARSAPVQMVVPHSAGFGARCWLSPARG